MPIVGPVDQVLKEMLKVLKEQRGKPDAAALKAWWEQIEEWRAMDCLKYEQDSEIIKPQYVVESLYKVTEGNAFVTSDVGQHQMLAAQFYKFDKPNAGSIPAGSALWGLVFRRRWVCSWPIRRKPSPVLPVKAVSRCVSRRCRPAASMRCR